MSIPSTSKRVNISIDRDQLKTLNSILEISLSYNGTKCPLNDSQTIMTAIRRFLEINKAMHYLATWTTEPSCYNEVRIATIGKIQYLSGAEKKGKEVTT